MMATSVTDLAFVRKKEAVSKVAKPVILNLFQNLNMLVAKKMLKQVQHDHSTRLPFDTASFGLG